MESETSKTGGGIISRRGPGFLLQEDDALCKAWVAVKEEILSGLSQNGSFWDRVLELYNELMGSPTHRTPKALSGRWYTIQQHISIFHVYLQHETIKDSSASLQSRIAGAKREFCVSQKFAFKWDNCWELLKDNTHWRKYQGSKVDMIDANKRLKPTLENDPIDLECASPTPTSPNSQPITPTPISFNINSNPVSSGQRKRKESEKKDEEQTVHLPKVADETNLLWNTFMCSVNERLGKIEDIARRNLQLKEEKMRQRQLEMRESQFERDRQIMDMNLEHMPALQRQFYEMKQKEICERWKIGEPIFTCEGSSGELECVGGPEL